MVSYKALNTEGKTATSSSNRTFMELKSLVGSSFTSEPACSNRTFMELKLFNA